MFNKRYLKKIEKSLPEPVTGNIRLADIFSCKKGLRFYMDAASFVIKPKRHTLIKKTTSHDEVAEHNEHRSHTETKSSQNSCSTHIPFHNE